MRIIRMINALEGRLGKPALRAAIQQLRSPAGVILMSQYAAIEIIYHKEFPNACQDNQHRD